MSVTSSITDLLSFPSLRKGDVFTSLFYFFLFFSFFCFFLQRFIPKMATLTVNPVSSPFCITRCGIMTAFRMKHIRVGNGVPLLKIILAMENGESAYSQARWVSK